jgi:3-dehydroquinate synthase
MTGPFTIVPHRSGSYPLYVGAGILGELPSIVGRVSDAALAVVVTSRRLEPLFGDAIAGAFARAGRSAKLVTFDEGEDRKTLATAGGIVDALIALGAKRDTVVIAAGGGVVGDTAGFAASIFLRGVDLVHVPTTLLAMVDSSIGGKVAVNHPSGKNLIGSFHQPAAVVSDVDLLATLPPRELLSGTFEALKSGVIGDRELFELLEGGEAPGGPLLEEVIRRSAAVKVAIVSGDERESGDRRLLNYGHTIGHALEAATGYGAVTHGEAVAWGMIGANAVASGRGLLSFDVARRIDAAVLAHGPAPLPPLDRGEVVRALEHDKKFVSSRRVMALPRAVGRCTVDEVEMGEIESGIDAAIAASAGEVRA